MSYALKSRLDLAKRTAESNAATRPDSAWSPHDWRDVARANAKRRYGLGSAWGPIWSDDAGRTWRFLERVEGSGLMVAVENATEKANRDRVTGYYVDTDQSDSQHGAVLATRDPESPKARFFAAITDPHNGGAYRVRWAVESDLDAAVHSADHYAEQNAEKARNHNAAWQAGSYWADLGETVAAARKQALEILRDRRTASGSETLCAVIREKVRNLVDEIQDAREKRDRLTRGEGASNDDWGHSFWAGDRDLQAAFNEGAGHPVFATAAPY